MLTVDEIAVKLHVSSGAVTRYIRTKQLEATKNKFKKGKGGSWEITEEALQRFLDARNNTH